MPPHCDSLDGPVVTAAKQALEETDFDVIVPYVQARYASELLEAFELSVKASHHGPEAREVAERYFFETAVRLHRAGEGSPFTGLKPAGLDVGPAIPAAERALTHGAPDEILDVVEVRLRDEVLRRYEVVMELKAQRGESVARAREYVEAMLDFEVWIHKVHSLITSIDDHGSGPHAHHWAHTRPSVGEPRA